MQIKFLQVLQEGKFRRVEDSAYRAADVRIIAATNKDLEAEVKKGNFRADLYYRLNSNSRPPIDRISLTVRFSLSKLKGNIECAVSGRRPSIL